MIVVPFDGTTLSEAALARGSEFGKALDQEILAVAVIPNSNTEYARRRGWLEAGEQFDPEAVVSRLSDQVTDVAPEAAFEYEVVDRYASAGVIAKTIRKHAKRAGAQLVVIGSENAGNIVTSVSSVGGSVASDDAYDVLIVRHPRVTDDD